MQSFWEIVASNALLVVALATGVALLGRVWKNPLCLHLLWLLVLLKLVTPPVFTVPIALPARQAPLASEAVGRVQRPTHQLRVDSSPQEVASTMADQEHLLRANDRPLTETPAAGLGDAWLVAGYQQIPWLTVLGWIWGVGIVMFASGHAYRIRCFRRLLHASEAPSSAVLGMAEGIAKRLGLSRVPDIRMLPVCVSPLVWSLGGRPQVFLPAALFERLDGAAQEAILAHELAHVRRGDHWVRLLEMAITTLVWWHPVVWLAAHRLRELEDQCCDAMVVDLAPHGGKSYATALLDTLDFLCERSIAAPLGATAAKSSISLTRRLAMLKNRSWTARLTVGRLVLLLSMSALPMAVAFGQKSPESIEKPSQPVVERRAINKLVKNFPEKIDLSTPEAASAALIRSYARNNIQAMLELSWVKLDAQSAKVEAGALNNLFSLRNDHTQRVLDTQIVEVLTYNEDLAAVIDTREPRDNLPQGYAITLFGRIGGKWMNLDWRPAPERLSGSVASAEKAFEKNKDDLWRQFMQVRNDVINGRTPLRDAKSGLIVTSDATASTTLTAPGASATSSKQPALDRRSVDRLVKDFPEKIDLSTPESAVAALNRAFGNPDPKFWLDLSAWKYSPRDVADIKRKMESNKDELAKTDEAYRNAEIIEVLTYRDGLAEVISKLNVSGSNRNAYSARTVVRIDGVWKNFGENRLASLEEARKDFDRIKDNLWANYLKVLDGIAKGKPVRLEGGDLSSSQPKRSAPIAPGEPLGISVEKADLMGRVEWAMMHGGRDITARKTIEWGDVEKDANGNRKIRYKFYATIWDKDVYTMNKVFTFDAKGNILDMEDVEGFPQKKVEKPVNVSTQEGMKELVEDFFSKNFRDITSRESIEWGEVTKAENGNSSIRYKYRAKIWDKDIKIMNQVFTFDPKGTFVSVKDVEGFPKNQ